MTVLIVTREPVNQHGFVSGVVVSCMLITAGWLAAGLVAVIADRKLSWSLALALLLSVWLIGGPSLVLWGPARLSDVPFGALLALAGIGAVALTMVAPIVTVVVVALTAFAWSADRVRHGLSP